MRARGFTLLELMVAISIFALIGIASYRVLSGVMQTNERLEARSEKMREINRALWVLQQDFEQLVQRDVRNADGTFAENPNYLVVDSEAELPLQLTRGGRSNPLNLPRSDMQRIAYSVEHHPDYEKSDSPHYHEELMYLMRYSWPMLDGAGAKEKAQQQILLPGVDSLAVTVTTEHSSEAVWPQAEPSDPPDVPMAVEVELTMGQESVKHSFKVW
ncbi:MAG: type secretion system protein GspJ [Verrucomicrobiaceae bacterium]|nr:type secretion system protein GspJ [Verrucomicrobiaceae bacterium]